MNRRQWDEYLRCARWERQGMSEAQLRWYNAKVRQRNDETVAAIWFWSEGEPFWPALLLLLVSIAAYVSYWLDFLLLPGRRQ